MRAGEDRRTKVGQPRSLLGYMKHSDHLSPEQRSAHMRLIRARDTKPEIVVRRIVHGMGFRFRLHRRDLPGRPDLALPRHRKAILVHGCFWHQHEGCRNARQPKTRLDYWLPKLARNVARDAEVRAELVARGWQVLEIFECETRKPDALRERLAQFLGPDGELAPISLDQ